MDVDMLIYVAGGFLMMVISIAFVVWGLKTRQFEESDHLKNMPLEEDEE